MSFWEKGPASISTSLKAFFSQCPFGKRARCPREGPNGIPQSRAASPQKRSKSEETEAQNPTFDPSLPWMEGVSFFRNVLLGQGPGVHPKALPESLNREQRARKRGRNRKKPRPKTLLSILHFLIWEGRGFFAMSFWKKDPVSARKPVFGGKCGHFGQFGFQTVQKK